MPYAIEVDAEARLACLTGTGVTDSEEGGAILAQLAEHPRFEPGFGLLCDLRRMQFEPTTDEMMAGLRNFIRFKAALRGRIAFVVGPELELVSEIAAALYASEGFHAQVFAELDAARHWVEAACSSDSAA